jgi:hypothetical protein
MFSIQCSLRASRGFWAAGLSTLALLLPEFGDGHAQAPQLSAARLGAMGCNVSQKHPLFVGFADDMTLDSFEDAASASRDIWHGFKGWLCDDVSAPGALGPRPASLYSALTRQHPIRVEQMQFDDAQFSHAHVVLRDVATKASGWHVHLHNDSDGWHVTSAAERPELR